jgi:hypothetical protein
MDMTGRTIFWTLFVVFLLAPFMAVITGSDWFFLALLPIILVW